MFSRSFVRQWAYGTVSRFFAEPDGIDAINGRPCQSRIPGGACVHCPQASPIVEEFAGSWYSKANYEGGSTRSRAARFLHVALTKAPKISRGRAERRGR